MDTKQQRQNEEFKVHVHKSIDELRESYTSKKLLLAKLKRQIARESKELGQAEVEAPSLAELSQRLKTLETKVDRILDAVGKRPR